MRATRSRVHLHAFLALTVAFLTACGSGVDQGTSATTPSTTAPVGTSTTVEYSTTSVATSTTEPITTTNKADAIEIVVEGGEVISGPDRIEAELGSTVTLLVVSDAIDHVHVHGYDIFFDLAPGRPEDIKFTADVPGIFEIELEDSHTLLVELEVR